MKIMVTGASGEYGQLALKYLKIFSPNDDLFGLVRHEGDAVDLKKMNVQPQIGDYANLESLKSAFKGIDKLLFVSVPVPGIQKMSSRRRCTTKLVLSLIPVFTADNINN